MPLIDLGKPFKLGFNDISDSRFNAKMWTIDTDSNLFNMAEKVPGQFMLPTTDGNGFSKNVPCFRSVDNANTILPVGLTEHSHSAPTDAEGGLLIDCLLDNIGNVNSMYGNWFHSGMYQTDSSGSGAGVTDSTGEGGSIDLVTGTTTDGYALMRTRAVPLGFDERITFMHRIDLSGPFTSYLMKFGVNAELITEANSNSTKSFGWEACNGNSHWLVFSCDGTTRSTTTTSITVAANDDVYEAQHFPADPSIQFALNHEDTVVTKNSNIPTSGGTSSSRNFVTGIKTTTSSQSKTMNHKGMVLHGRIGTGDWEWYL